MKAKKILSLLLAIAMILGMLPMTGLPVYAADEPQILEVSTGPTEQCSFSSNSGITIKLTKDITFEYEYRGKRPVIRLLHRKTYWFMVLSLLFEWAPSNILIK